MLFDFTKNESLHKTILLLKKYVLSQIFIKMCLHLSDKNYYCILTPN